MSHSSVEASPPTADVTMDDDEISKASSENSGVDAAKRGLLEKDDQEPPEKKTKTDTKPWRSEELQSYWQSVEDDPSDFTSWTHILQFVSAKGNIEEGREAFNTFLAKFPYCYGYWKKYADFEKKLGSEDTCQAVFERGFKAIPLSVDLWVHYVNHVRADMATKNTTFVREQYERAVAACGREWKSDKLWDHYLKWELSLQEESDSTVKNYTTVMSLYDRIMKNPTQGLTVHFDKFKQFVVDHNFQEILDTMTFLELRKKVLTEIHTSDTPKDEGDTDNRPKIDDEICLMRDEIIIAREKVFKETEVLVKERSKFEDTIKRPYFHIKPLEKSQLENWNSYLEFEEKQGDPERIEILYERCMISCALYEAFWIKYINWMKSREKELTDDSEKSVIVAKIRDIFARANIHLGDKIHIQLEQSAFEESHGNFKEAIAILERCTYSNPLLMSLKLKRINAERRQGNITMVHSLYKGCIDEAESVKVRSEWCLKYAKFLKFICGDDLKGINLLAEAVAIDEDNAKLRLLHIDCLLQMKPFDKSKLIEAIDCAINEHKFDCHQRLLFAKRKVAILEEFGDDVNQLLDAEKVCEAFNVEIESAGYHHHEGGEHEDPDASATSKQSNGTGYDATNSASYSAQHASSYQQYGARYGYPGYNNYPGNYYGGGYSGYGQY